MEEDIKQEVIEESEKDSEFAEEAKCVMIAGALSKIMGV